ILQRISDFVPAWQHIPNSHSPPDFEFIPHHILACSLVCRTWYSIFYPALWTVYDGHAMSNVRPHLPTPSPSSSASSKHDDYDIWWTSVPKHLLISQSPRFRIFFDPGSRHASNVLSFQCRQLVDMSLHGSCTTARHLLSMNPRLKRLAWSGPTPYLGELSPLDTNALMLLEPGQGCQLESLMLRNWDVSDGRLLRGLSWVSKSLVRLTLRDIQGLDNVDHGVRGTNDAGDAEEAGGVVNTAEQTNIENGHPRDRLQLDQSEQSEQQHQQSLVLHSLVELTVDCEWLENLALLEFIAECCPRLEALRLSVALLDDEAMIGRLEKVLVEQGRFQHKHISATGIDYSLGATQFDGSGTVA
ncbi:hypothetical protein BGX31_009175, partial [Mortierella sp. GBA43]